MADILSGKEVAAALNEQLKRDVAALYEKGITPSLCIVRIGDEEADVAYERGALKRAETVGVHAESHRLPADISQANLLAEIDKINRDDSIHGALLLRPFPAHIDDKAVCAALRPDKDVDGITEQSMAGVYAGRGAAFPPCTAEACLAILDHYGIDPTGQKVVVIGRSLVVGRPVSMLLLQRNATVTICHTKTKNLPAVCRDADLLIVAAGQAKNIGPVYVREGQIIIDVGIHADEQGNLCGDVDFDAVETTVKAITPVPGGVGPVTASILMKNVVRAAHVLSSSSE